MKRAFLYLVITPLSMLSRQNTNGPTVSIVRHSVQSTGTTSGADFQR